MTQEDTELADASKMVKLMGESDQATKHMKCPIKAAFFVPSFVQFITPTQKRELKQYKKEVAEAEAVDSAEVEEEDEY